MVAEPHIIAKIEEKLPSLTLSQKKVADYVLKNPMQAAFSTVNEIAKLVRTSTTTVVRLALTLEYSGFMEFQKSLQGFLKTTAAPATKLDMNIKKSHNRNNIISEIAKQQIENINTTYTNLPDENILLAAKKISGARHTYVFGQRSCYSVSHYLAYNINRILGNCDFIYNSFDTQEYLHRITNKDVIIAISMPRYIKQIVRFAEIAHARGAFVIVISDGYVSPFIPISNIVLFSEGRSRDFHNSMTSSMFIADILIGVLSDQNHGKARVNLTDTESISGILETHIR